MIFTKILSKLLRTVSQSPWAKDLRHKRRFPGVAIHTTANIEVLGSFVCRKSNINSGSQIIVKAGTTLELGDGSYVGRNVELSPLNTIRIGRNTSIQDRSIILGNVQIGDHCLFSYNVYISSGTHHFEIEPWSLIKDQDSKATHSPSLKELAAEQVVIEDDCWIGVNVVVMSGVTIGKGAIVGANAVVTKDVAPYTVVAGIPARELRKRLDFQPPTSINWDIEEDLPYFYSGFEILNIERARNASIAGLVVQKSACCLALNGQAGSKLYITAKLSGNSSHASLCSLGVKHKLTKHFQEFVFPVMSKTYLHSLTVQGLSPHSMDRMVIQSARII